MNKFFTAGPLLLLVFSSVGLASEDTMTNQLANFPPGAEEDSVLSGLPVPLRLDRYQPLSKKSPFTAVTMEETAGFAQGLMLAGYVRLKGDDFVMVANRNTPDRFLVGRKESPSARGLMLLELMKDPKGDPTKMKAKIKKGQETAVIGYEVAGPPAPPAGQPPAPGAPVPGQGNPGGIPGQALPSQIQPGQNRPSAPVIRRRVIPVPPASRK